MPYFLHKYNSFLILFLKLFSALGSWFITKPVQVCLCFESEILVFAGSSWKRKPRLLKYFVKYFLKFLDWIISRNCEVVNPEAMN